MPHASLPWSPYRLPAPTPCREDTKKGGRRKRPPLTNQVIRHGRRLARRTPPKMLLSWPRACAAFKRRGGSRLFGAIADADEFQHGPRTRIAEARFGQTHDPRVAAGAAVETRSDGIDQHGHGILIAQHHVESTTKPTTDRRSSPIACSDRSCTGLPLFAVASGLGAELFPPARRCSLERRASVMQRSTSGRTSFAFSSVVTMRPLTFGVLHRVQVRLSSSRSVRNGAGPPDCATTPAGGWGYGLKHDLFYDDA